MHSKYFILFNLMAFLIVSIGSVRNTSQCWVIWWLSSSQLRNCCCYFFSMLPTHLCTDPWTLVWSTAISPADKTDSCVVISSGCWLALVSRNQQKIKRSMNSILQARRAFDNGSTLNSKDMSVCVFPLRSHWISFWNTCYIVLIF